MNKHRLVLLGCVMFSACASSPRQDYAKPTTLEPEPDPQQLVLDMQYCENYANDLVAKDLAEDTKSVAGKTIREGAIGGAAGAAGGAIYGAAGHGAAVGAVVGATAALVRGLFDHTNDTPSYAALFDRCMRRKGYETE